MLFTQLPVQRKPNKTDRGAFLVNDMWDDYSFKTSFHLWCFNGTRQIEIGFFKITTFGMDHGRVHAPDSFRELDSNHFSLGADESYYATLRNEFDEGTRLAILTALRDAAYDLEIFEQAEDEQVMAGLTAPHYPARDGTRPVPSYRHRRCNPDKIQHPIPPGVAVQGRPFTYHRSDG